MASLEYLERTCQAYSDRIICRAFQGFGGAGVYSLTLYSFVRIVPYRHFDKVSSLAGGISSLGLVLGPLLGGAIANNGSWRWVFLYKYVMSRCLLAHSRLIITIVYLWGP